MKKTYVIVALGLLGVLLIMPIFAESGGITQMGQSMGLDFNISSYSIEKNIDQTMNTWEKYGFTKEEFDHLPNALVGAITNEPKQIGHSFEVPDIISVAKSEQKSFYSEKGEYDSNMPMLIIDGKFIGGDIMPIIKNDQTMVPVRMVAEALNYEVNWIAKEQKVILVNHAENKNIVLSVGSDKAVIDGQNKIKLDAAPFIQNNRTFVPVRFVAEALGKYVDWNTNDRAVIVTTSKPVATQAQRILFDQIISKHDIMKGLLNKTSTFNHLNKDQLMISKALLGDDGDIKLSATAVFKDGFFTHYRYKSYDDTQFEPLDEPLTKDDSIKLARVFAKDYFNEDMKFIYIFDEYSVDSNDKQMATLVGYDKEMLVIVNREYGYVALASLTSEGSYRTFIPDDAVIENYDQTALNVLLKYQPKERLVDVLGKPDKTELQRDVWVFDTMHLTVNYMTTNKAKVKEVIFESLSN